MHNLLKDLNPQQREAVTYLEGPLLVLAGAGSGKTRVITYRIGYLIEQNIVRPAELLAVTFTNKAADEMKSRVAHLLGTDLPRMWISTFHSACVRILRRHIHLLGYTPEFSIYDTDDQLSLIRDCFDELGYDTKQLNPRAVLGEISRAKNKLIPPENFYDGKDDFFLNLVKNIYVKYQDHLKKNDAVDFDDLLSLTVQLFERFPEVLRRYQDQFRHILVDEYQDTNHAQYVLIKKLAEPQRQICVVGDDDQSIYGWRGADIRNILNFEKDYPEVKVIMLEQNYRSTPQILAAANRLISKNPRRHRKVLKTTRQSGAQPEFFYAPDELTESDWVCQQLLNWKNQGKRKWRQVAIFYRTHAQSRVLEDMLRRARIPYTIVSGIRFYERKEIKDIIAYLRLLINPADEIALERIINVPGRGIGNSTITRLKQFAAEKQISLYYVLEHIKDIPSLHSGVRSKIIHFVTLIESFRNAMDNLPVHDLVKTIIDRLDYFEYLKSFDPEDGESRIENVKELVSAVTEFELRSEDKTLAAFLNEVSLLTNMDIHTEATDAVQLMTLHSAKGLEFPLVFMIGMEENLFPCVRDEDHLEFTDEIEEERRLCYVGLTRAKEQVILTAASSRRQYGQIVYNPPSRFLVEINPEWQKKFYPLSKIAPSMAKYYSNTNWRYTYGFRKF
ncbi:MAG: UvrD-helicase domain-containing protein [bacterium]|nr:UvrD-helicase domain-containing protein [bacterium]